MAERVFIVETLYDSSVTSIRKCIRIVWSGDTVPCGNTRGSKQITSRKVDKERDVRARVSLD